jgi:hypothetical protein
MRYGPYKRLTKTGTYPDGMPVAIEYDGDEYPALIGVIIACFAADDRDAIAICGTLRSFNAKLEILEALLKLREIDSHDKIIYGHCKGLLKQAVTIRNHYAHALYAKGQKMRMSPYHHDLKHPNEWIDLDLEDLKKDKKRVSIILGELFSILHQKELPKAIYDKLLPQDR